ncbi:MAG: LysR family transcriptional regulator [Halopseudomonas sp.]
MNFKRLETFVWVATLGSFRKTAERQFTTQPAISSRIAALESELGVKLFERDGGPGPVTLTAKGQELLPYAEKVIFMSEQLRKRADNSLSLSGILRMGVSETIVHTWLPEFFSRLHSDMPNLDVELTVDTTNNLRNGLLDRSLDIAFLMGPISAPSITNLELCTFPLIWAASPALTLENKIQTPEELAHWPIITYARNTKPFAEISHKFRELGSQPARFFASSSLAACLRLTLDAVGISTLPKVMIAKELADGTLKQVEATWTPSQLDFTASYSVQSSSALIDPVAELAIQVAKEHSPE